MKWNRVVWVVMALLLVLAVLVACNPAPQEQPAVVDVPVRAPIERIGILCRDAEGGDCVTVYNGSDINIYSDEGSTSKFMVEGSIGLMQLTTGSTVGTATPAVIIQKAAGSNALEVRNASATPVFVIGADGAATYTGFSSAGGEVAAAAAVAAPTAVGTATPAFYVNNAGVSNLFEARKNATPMFSINGSGNTSVSGTLGSTGAVTVGTDGAGADVTFYSGTSGDNFLWDASEEKLIVTGTNAQTALDVADGNVVINDNLTVTAGAFDVTAGATTLEALTTGVDGTGADVKFYSDTAGDYLLWDESDEKLVIIGTNGQTALDVQDGNVSVTDALAVTGATTLGSDVTLSGLSDGNNALAKNEYIGLPRIKLVGLGGGTNPASQTIAWIDANPTGEWAEVDAGTNLAVTADTTYYRDVTNSVKLAFTDVVDNDGVDGTVTQVDLGDMESLGFWIYSDTAISSGDFDVTLDDTDGTDQTYSVGAVSANVWTWVELNIAACDANCNTVDGVKFLATTQGGTALTAANVYLDAMYVWDAADEEALGVAIQRDGVLGVINAAAGTSLVEWTDYIVHEESGVDFIVWITDQSSAFPFCLVAY